MGNIPIEEIKTENQSLLLSQGFAVNEWLPVISDIQVRSLEEVKGRMSVMTALVNIAFNAPVPVIKGWIQNQKLNSHLSNWEIAVLEKKNKQPTEDDVNGLQWYLESLWALMWVAKLIDAMPATQPVENFTASLLPNLQKREDNSKIEAIREMRNDLTICYVLDYYFRLHWYCVDQRLKSKQAGVNEGIVYHRRRALEWVGKSSIDWDEVPIDT